MSAVTVFKTAYGLYKTDVGPSTQLGALEAKLNDADIGLNLPYIHQSRLESENGRVVLISELGGVEAIFLTPVVVLLLSDPLVAEAPNPIVFFVGLLALVLPRAIGHLRHQKALRALT